MTYSIVITVVTGRFEKHWKLVSGNSLVVQKELKTKEKLKVEASEDFK